jgi:hypothetical protein
MYRVIVVDGVEVNRGEPFFQEVQAAYPQLIEEYFTALAAWAHALGDYLDSQNEFTALNFTEMNKASRLFFDYEQKFDYVAYVSGMPQFQPPDLVVEELSEEESEETPVTE